MKKQYLSVSEASVVCEKSINTIRNLIKSNKIKYTKEDRKYIILKTDLALYYKDKKDEILSFWEDKKEIGTNNSSTNDVTNKLDEHLKPLIESLQFHIKKYDDVQKLLTNSYQEKNELEKDYTQKIELQKSSFLQEKKSLNNNHEKLLNKKSILIKILFTLIWLLLLLILFQSKIITINF